jgi:hypothetical protein
VPLSFAGISLVPLVWVLGVTKSPGI